MHLGYQNLNGVPDDQRFMQETKLVIGSTMVGANAAGQVASVVAGGVLLALMGAA